jgi:transcriptional regulator with XRE-family HTH domain
VPTFGEWLKKERRGLGWNQRQLAAATKTVSQPTISRLERGDTSIAAADPETITGLAHALDIPITELLRAAGIEVFAGLDVQVVQAAYDLQQLPQLEREAILRRIADAVRATQVADKGEPGGRHRPD